MMNSANHEHFSEFGYNQIKQMADDGTPVHRMMFEIGLPLTSKPSLYRYCDRVGIKIRNRSLDGREYEKASDLDAVIDGMKPADAISHLKFVINLLTGHDDDTFEHWRRLGFTPREVKIILFLLNRKGEVCSSERIYNATVTLFDAASEKNPSVRVIDVHICKIRKKFVEKSIPWIIKNSWGTGYYITPNG